MNVDKLKIEVIIKIQRRYWKGVSMNEIKEKQLCAHISKDKRKQSVKEHCDHTAEYAYERVGIEGFEYTIRLAAWLHDMGKLTDEFQEYLEKQAENSEETSNKRVIHSFTGAVYILEKHHTATASIYEKVASELIAYVIGAHHGLFDALNQEKENGLDHRLFYSKDAIHYEEAISRYFQMCHSEKELEQEFTKAVHEVEYFLDIAKNMSGKHARNTFKPETYNARVEQQYYWGMLIRMITSVVMYGDRTDTREFMWGEIHKSTIVKKEFWTKQLNFMESKLGNIQDDSELASYRRQISESCKAFADVGDGIYKLSVPTGSGKTLSTLRYAYTLAAKLGKRKVIFVVPLLSVIEQNAKVIKDHTKNVEAIGEYHSGLIQDKDKKEEISDAQITSDYWNEPIIITTMYQILMNMFTDKTTYVTRFSALADSVLVFDEAQNLPMRDIHLFNMVVNFLQKFCRTTIVLCSATQPCLENVIYPIDFEKMPDMVSLNIHQIEAFKRVAVHNLVTPCGMKNYEIVNFTFDRLEKKKSVLLICNTKQQAHDLYESLKAQKDDEIQLFHLSTAMCAQNRQDVLQETCECLDSKRKMICVATQLVEAGIDFSFEVVIRSLAGMDSIVQAFGRCNRSFEYGKMGEGYIIRMQEENLTMLGDIKESQISTASLLEAFQIAPEDFDHDLLGKKAIRYYYMKLFNEHMNESGGKGSFDHRVLKDGGEEDTLLNLLSVNNKVMCSKKCYFTCQAFKTAGKQFTVFETDTVDVIAPYKKGKDIIVSLCSAEAQYDIGFRKEKIKEASRYTVQIWKNQLTEMIKEGVIIQVTFGKDEVFYYINQDFYHSDRGFSKKFDSCN